MKTLATLMLLAATLPAFAQEGKPPRTLRFEPRCILDTVMKRKNLAPRPAVPFPAIFFASQIPVEQFDDAVEPQWGFRPGQVLNAYIARLNEVYLVDDAEYYDKTGRFVDDSLAHELVHYLQVTYQNADLADESLEPEAVDIQTWFRETFLLPANAPKPCE